MVFLNTYVEKARIYFDFLFTDAPTCAPNQQRIYGVAKQEQAQIKCVVDANPSDVEFKWTFNNSAESIDVANNHVTRTGMVYADKELQLFSKQKTEFSLYILYGRRMLCSTTVYICRVYATTVHFMEWKYDLQTRQIDTDKRAQMLNLSMWRLCIW